MYTQVEDIGDASLLNGQMPVYVCACVLLACYSFIHTYYVHTRVHIYVCAIF